MWPFRKKNQRFGEDLQTTSLNVSALRKPDGLRVSVSFNVSSVSFTLVPKAKKDHACWLNGEEEFKAVFGGEDDVGSMLDRLAELGLSASRGRGER